VTQLFFKLEEEGKPALLLLLPALIAEAPVFGSASGLGCRLVEATSTSSSEKQHSGLLLLCQRPPSPYLKAATVGSIPATTAQELLPKTPHPLPCAPALFKLKEPATASSSRCQEKSSEPNS
jgi:hypothetical protein